MIIDIDELRQDMLDYYGTAMASGMPMAVFELSQAECASDEELVSMAEENGIDLSRYEI